MNASQPPISADDSDYWSDEDFEETVASALIACYETKVRKQRGSMPSDRLNDNRIAALRLHGPYIGSNSRLVHIALDGQEPWSFDTTNDPLPISGVVAHRASAIHQKQWKHPYLIAHHIKRASALGKHWQKTSGGTLYEMTTMVAEQTGINGYRSFFTVAKNGALASCTQKFHVNGKVVELDKEIRDETEAWGSMTLQILADRRFCWSITAKEKAAKAHLGCMAEEIKSLLYARDLPMTATGRKRPILHLVEAHKRRLRNGTDIDVTGFLRGQQTVEISGTIFQVNPPATLLPKVSAPSRQRYSN